MNDRLKLTSLPATDDADQSAAIGLALDDLTQRQAKLDEIDRAFEDLSKLRPLSEEQQAQWQQILDERDALAQERRELLAEQAALRDKANRAGNTRHVAHEERQWLAVCTAPDYCKVGKHVVAFDSYAELDMEHLSSPDVKARGTPVYRIDDMIQGVLADAGRHVVAGTSLDSGYVKILDGHANVKVNGRPVARHDSECRINCNAAGEGGAPGTLVTEVKTTQPPSEAHTPQTSERLEALKAQREALSDYLIDFDKADSIVDFETSNTMLDSLIGGIQGTKGTWTDTAAQVTRGVVGFTKDAVMGIGELAYEGIKGAGKLSQRLTPIGQMEGAIDAQILAEEIRLGNVSAGSMADGAANAGKAFGKALVKPVTDPWKRGDYAESVTRGALDWGALIKTAALAPVKLLKGKGLKAIADEAAEEASEASTDAAKASDDVAATEKAADEAGKDGGKSDDATADSSTDKAEESQNTNDVEGAAGGNGVHVAKRGFAVDSSMFAADEAAGVLSNGKYIKNPTAQNLSNLVTDSGRIGGKNMNGQYMYVIDQDGSIIIGSRGGQRMPHPTLIGGENPQALGAGIVDIRGGKIYSVDNASGHFKPGAGSLDAARDAFGNLPSNVFHKNFQGYLPYKPGGN